MPKGSDGAANASPPLCTCLGQGAAGGWRRERGARHFPGGCSGAAGPPAPPPTLSQQQAGACSHPSVCGHLNHGSATQGVPPSSQGCAKEPGRGNAQPSPELPAQALLLVVRVGSPPASPLRGTRSLPRHQQLSIPVCLVCSPSWSCLNLFEGLGNEKQPPWEWSKPDTPVR